MIENQQLSSCPLCGKYPIQILQNIYGIHCEGLTCSNCGVNARNRFYYFGLKKTIERITGISSNGLAMEEKDLSGSLKMLEASSFGFASLGESFVKGMLKYGALTCSDYYENNFKGVAKIDLCEMPFEDNSIDIIAHSHVLEHIEDDEKAIGESFRCLSNRGYLILSVPVQTDFTFVPSEPEYHGDNALVYRRNGWDLIKKLKKAGFIVEVYVSSNHLVFNNERCDPKTLVIDNVTLEQKFGAFFSQYKEIFYPMCNLEESNRQYFSNIWGQLELFICHKNIA